MICPRCGKKIAEDGKFCRYCGGFRWASYWLSWLALAASLLYIVAAYAYDRLHYGILYSSDAMFIPVFFRDVVTRGTLSGWDLPTNPYFFPDMLLFIPLLAIVSEIHLSVILFGLIQLLLLVTGMVLLQRELFGTNRHAQTLLLLTLTLCMLLIATGRQIFYPFTLMSVHHTSVLVMIPFATVVMLRMLQPKRTALVRRRTALLLFALTLLASLSDTLFIIQFVLPALVASLGWGKREQIPWRRLLLMDGGLLLSAAAGQWIRQWVVPVDKFLVYVNNENGEAVSTSFSNFTIWLNQVILKDPLFVTFWLITVAAIISVIIVCVRTQRHEMRAQSLVATLCLNSMIISIVAVIMSGNFKDPFSARYILPTIYLPLFTGLPLLFATWLSLYEGQKGAWHPNQNLLLWRATGPLSVLAIGYMLFTSQPVTLTSLTEYQDSFLACLEQETAQRQIRHGLAGYWQADSISARSEGRLNVIPVGRDLSPIFWNNNRDRYKAPFEFVIIDEDASEEWRIRKEFVLQRFGQPAETFECERSDIYVYNRSSDAQIRHWFANRPELAQLEQVGDEAELFGYALPSANGGVSIGLSQGASEQWGNNEGTLTYASFQALPASSYAVAFDLYADSANTGFFEVVDKSEDSAILLATEPIEATGKSMVRGHFDLQQEANIEIRVKYGGHGTLFVDKMRIARVAPAQAASFEFAESPAPDDTTAQGSLSLIHPYPGSFIDSRNVDFVWQLTGQPLPKEQTFEVRLWEKGESIHYGAHDAIASTQLIRQIGDTYILRLDLNGAHSVMQHGDGQYEWTVAIVAIEPAYQDLQIEATPYSLSLLP